MIGVGGVRAIAFAAQHQPVGTQYIKEAVTAQNKLLTKVLCTKVVKLAATGMGKMIADVATIVDDAAD